MRWWLTALLLSVSLGAASADPDPSRCLPIPSSGSVVIVNPFGTGTLPFSSGIVIVPGMGVTMRPLYWSQPIVALPGGYFYVRFQSGNWTVVWLEPLRTNVVVVGRPYLRYPRPLYWAPPIYWAPPTLLDPSVTLGIPQVWHSPFLQPGVLIFRLKHRSAEEVAKVLNEAKVLPDGQFVGMGNILIVSAPSLATSGVQQSRLRDLIQALDQPTEPRPSPTTITTGQWRLEVYRVHPATCVANEPIAPDRAPLLELSGYRCAHKIGEGTWDPNTQPKVFLKGDKVDLTLQGQRTRSGWRLSLTGQWHDQKVQLDEEVPSLSQPMLLVPPLAEGKEAFVLLLLPPTSR